MTPREEYIKKFEEEFISDAQSIVSDIISKVDFNDFEGQAYIMFPFTYKGVPGNKIKYYTINEEFLTIEYTIGVGEPDITFIGGGGLHSAFENKVIHLDPTWKLRDFISKQT